jgi:putative YhbY family RNA-binding protein
MVLTSAQRKLLRAQAHSLHPLVMIGDKGLSESVLLEIDRSLLSHELIKVRVSMDDRVARDQTFAAICAGLKADSVQTIGKILVIYRANPDKVTKPAAVTRPSRNKRKEARPTKKTFQDR